MVHNPVNESGCGGHVASKDDIVRRYVEGAAQAYELQCGRSTVSYAAAFLLPDGRWDIITSPDLPEQHVAHIHHALNDAPRPNDSPAGTDQSLAPSDSRSTDTPVPAAPRKRTSRDALQDEEEENEDEDWHEVGQQLGTIALSEDGDESILPTSDASIPGCNGAFTRVDFHVESSPKDFFRKRIHALQQLTVKALLKQWIKTVEPRKQSRYSYVAKVNPPWWPKKLQFREPDHMHLHDRIELCLAVLTIYQDENLVKHLDKSSQEHARRGTAQNGWIDMLRNSTRDLPLTFDSEKGAEERRIARKEILRDIYDAAYVMEEIFYEERDERHTKSYKDIPTRSRSKKKDANPRPMKAATRSMGQRNPLGPLTVATDHLKFDGADHLLSPQSLTDVPMQQPSTPEQAANMGQRYRRLQPSTTQPAHQQQMVSHHSYGGTSGEGVHPNAYRAPEEATYSLSRESSLQSGSGGVYHTPIMTPEIALKNMGSSSTYPSPQGLRYPSTSDIPPHSSAGSYHTPKYSTAPSQTMPTSDPRSWTDTPANTNVQWPSNGSIQSPFSTSTPSQNYVFSGPQMNTTSANVHYALSPDQMTASFSDTDMSCERNPSRSDSGFDFPMDGYNPMFFPPPSMSNHSQMSFDEPSTGGFTYSR